MSTPVNIGLVDTTELTRVFDTIWMLRMEGKNIPGITVFCERGRRKWWITTEKFSILVTGETADFSGAYQLPLTILANAGRQQAANGSVTFTITEGVVTAESALGSQSVGCATVPVPRPHRVALARSRATAKLGGKELVWVTFSGANVPFEAMMFDDERPTPDFFTIGIEPGRLVITSDWTKAQLYEMRGSTAAETKGSGQIKIDPDLLSVLFGCVDGESEWSISFDPREPREIVLESDTQYIVANMAKVPVVDLHDSVVRILEHEKVTFQQAGNGVIGIRMDDVVVSCDFFQREEDEEPMVRLSTIVTRNANESSELLREINAHNNSGSLTRLWFANGSVSSAIEVVRDNLHTFPNRLRHLAKEGRRLKGVLEPFAAEAALPTPVTKRRRRRANPKVQPEVWD